MGGAEEKDIKHEFYSLMPQIQICVVFCFVFCTAC